MSNHTPREAILIGATGLVGQTLLAILAQDYAKVTVIARRKPSTIAPNIDAHVLKDFAGLKDLLATLALDVNTDAFSCLGTTRKAAGSAERFRQIDYGYNLAFAQACRAQGVERFFCCPR
ncbi:NAD-dependent epimerase/dehydratase family protein [Faucicola atlantae]|uniref:NAD-dependent epimerase/dehydratase family protein n=1 Tax=Faucicola atlantae TaxID=34059 RepID=UPI0025AF0703|nr:NAD-dependent epimerase/dehydratase family protein [Moraxella atlantae]